jgi:hypothetical protein
VLAGYRLFACLQKQSCFGISMCRSHPDER